MRISKSLAATVAAASLGGGALALIAPAAALAAAPPAGSTAVAGIATAAGTPTANITVTLYQANADGTFSSLGDDETAADGSYYFDLSNHTTSDGGPVNTPSPGTTLRLLFEDDRTLTGDQLALHYQYYANQPTIKRSTPLAQPTAGTTESIPTVALSYNSGVKGTVSVPAPAGYYAYGFVEAFDADDNEAAQAGFNTDPSDDATNSANGLSTYTLRNLTPGQPYKLYFSGDAEPISATGPTINYIGHFYGGDQTFGSATVVTAPASGTITQPINGSVTNAISSETAPSIIGQVAPGKTLSVDPGTWSLKANNEYSYQWLLNGAVVSTSPTFAVAKSYLGKQLQVVVTNRVDDYLGSAATPAEKVKYATKLKAKAHGAYIKGKKVAEIKGKLKVSGVKKKKLAKALKGAKAKVYEVSKTDDTVMVKVGKAKIKGGKLLVVIKGLTAGKHYLEIDVSGKKIADVTKTVKVKI